MEKILLIAFILMGAALNATVISAWTFENTLIPSTGSGSVSLVGGVTDDGFNTGYNGGLAWSTTSYPAQGTNNTTAGIVINVSTANFQNITISWALRHSNKSANKAVLFYTLDRTVSEPVWIQADIYNATSGDSWFPNSFNASSITGMNNNPNLAFKLVSAFGNTENTLYMPSNPSSTYDGGKWRFDDIIVEGISSAPYVEITANLQPFFALPGTSSEIQTYQIIATNLTGNLIVTAPQYFYLRLFDTDSFASSLELIPRNGNFVKQIQVVFQPSVSGSYTGNISHSGGGIIPQDIEVSGSTIFPEPTNYPVAFTTAGVTYYQAYLNWIDSTGTSLPNSYLIKGSEVSLADIADPVDGIPENDAELIKNVSYSVQTQLFYGLKENQTYYFKIFPYTNSGETINYKVDANAPSVQFTTSTGPVGSVLLPGDLAFVEYATDSPDRFSFVLLKDIQENTKMYFTDKAYNGTAFLANEALYEWRGVGRSYAKGEVIHLVEGQTFINEGIHSPGVEGLSNDGDQIIAFQGTLDAPSFISAISSTGWLTEGTVNNNSSYLPSTLTLGVNALGFATEVDDGVYNGATTGSVAEIRTAINNPENWTRAGNLNNISFPVWNFVLNALVMSEPVITQISSTTIRISWQQVSGATHYNVYKSSLPYASFTQDWVLAADNITGLFWETTEITSPRQFYRIIAVN